MDPKDGKGDVVWKLLSLALEVIRTLSELIKTFSLTNLLPFLRGGASRLCIYHFIPVIYN